MTELVTLIIKAVNQAVPDHKIECELDLLVLHLKEKLRIDHPGTPLVCDQRLIYLGQLLQDNLSLRTVLRHPPENNAYTLHLVYPSPNPIKKTTDLDSVRISSSSAHSNSESSFLHTMESDGVRRRNVGNESVSTGTGQGFNQTNFYPYLAQMPPPLQAATDPIQQMVALQQMYSQYMASYMHYMQTGNMEAFQSVHSLATNNTSTPVISASVIPSITTITSTTTTTEPALPEQQPEVPQPQANVQPQAENNAPARVNPQGNGIFGEEEEEGVARDWLDYIYFGSRMAVLLSIVYFYSTLARFTLVICTSLFIYLYQIGFFRLGRNGDPIPDPNPQQEADQPINEGAERVEQVAEPEEHPPNAGTEPIPEPGEGTDEVAEEASPASSIQENATEHPQPQPSIMALSLTFLTTFFTSLIPEQQQIV